MRGETEVVLMQENRRNRRHSATAMGVNWCDLVAVAPYGQPPEYVRQEERKVGPDLF
jgi:hypothetical protein